MLRCFRKSNGPICTGRCSRQFLVSDSWLWFDPYDLRWNTITL